MSCSAGRWCGCFWARNDKAPKGAFGARAGRSLPGRPSALGTNGPGLQQSDTAQCRVLRCGKKRSPGAASFHAATQSPPRERWGATERPLGTLRQQVYARPPSTGRGACHSSPAKTERGSHSPFGDKSASHPGGTPQHGKPARRLATPPTPREKNLELSDEEDQLLHRAQPQPPSFHSAVEDISPFVGSVGQGRVFLRIEPITKLGFASQTRSMRGYLAPLASKSVSPAHEGSSTAPGAVLLLERSSPRGRVSGVRCVERQAERAAVPQPVIRAPHPYKE